MFNWFDLMQQAQTNAGLDALTRQFQLSGEQSQRAMAAFLPAFAMGLQHAMMSQDPNRFFQSMLSGGYQNFWQAAGRSFSSQAQQEGRKLLDQLFGSDEVSRRVAHQAADYAGISVDTMQQILPLLAGIVAGGMSHWMSAQAQALQAFSSQAGAAQDGQGNANPWAELWTGWMKAATPGRPSAANPFEEMSAAFLQMAQPPRPTQEASPSSSPSWEAMMEQGREMQAQYLASLQSIFEEAWKIEPRKS